MLIEPAATNKMDRSQDFNHGDWGENSVTLTGDTVTAPDGTLTAGTCLATNANAAHSITQLSGITSVGTNTTSSVYLKAGTHQYVTFSELQSSTVTRYAYATVDLSNGTITQSGHGAGSSELAYVSSAIQSVGDGWYRVSVTWTTASDTGNHYFCLQPNSSGTPTLGDYGIETWDADGDETFYVWGGQVEEASAATSYIPTISSTVTRAIDVITVAASTIPESATEDTVYADVKCFDIGANQVIFDLYEGGSSRVGCFFDDAASPDWNQYGLVGGSVDANFSLGNVTYATRHQGSMAYKANDFAGSLDGAAVQVDTTIALSFTPTALRLGNDNPASSPMNGFIYRFALVPRRVVDGDLL